MLLEYLTVFGAILLVPSHGDSEPLPYNGADYLISGIVRENQESWTQLIEVLGFEPAKLPDRHENITVVGQFLPVTVSLTDGYLDGLKNAILRPEDEFHVIAQKPLLITGNMTFPESEVEYVYTTPVNSGRVNIAFKNATFELRMYVTPESKTESIDPKARFVSYGAAEITFSESSLDQFMQLFEGRIRKKLPEIVQVNTALITSAIKEKVNRLFPNLAQKAVDVVRPKLTV
ncbi:hypothetical protein QAD02_010046 [Eretmocerus hayati]|uniref:Uncharacterized protein n=1 Tax=Eretmocerus hayati TaxID=131215 RepID=A0ACC2NBR2_9HYME|nr:hypothetical protein QAD02_010046 [Eretmocerus hayati]